MFTKISKPHALPGGDNKGSSLNLANYLEKEDVGKSVSDQTLFFSHTVDKIGKDEAVASIDNNNKNLGRNDNKFFMLTIAPSKDEIKHLILSKTGKEVDDLSALSKDERAIVNKELKAYTRDVMDIYAKNFNRKGVDSGADLVYFAKVETCRAFKHYEKQVIENKEIQARVAALESELKRSGNEKVRQQIENLKATYHRQGNDIIKNGLKKSGHQMHVHVVVSRNNVTQTIKLSPLSKSKGGMQKLNGKEVMQGFNHEKFKRAVGERFNEKYNYNPKASEQYKQKSKQNSAVGPIASKFGDKALRTGKSKLVTAIKKEVLQGHFSEELSAIRTAKTGIKLLKNPKSTLVNMAKNKLFEILKGAALGK
ncbi:MAG: hypothetical protein E6Q85_00510 [Thiothrix sp.]|nr:MAG: hypothetical protein E6Q85_00510 [Thiothrix sp.]